MFEREIIRYDTLLKEHRQQVTDKFSAEDLKEYNEILSSAHGCVVEGNTFSVDDTRALRKRGLGLVPQGRTLLEASEILGRFKAYGSLMGQTDQPLTEQLIRDTHRILAEHTLTYQYKDAVPGGYMNTGMGAENTIFGDRKELVARVPKLMEATQKTIEERLVHPVEIAAQFHRHFVFLRPFQDGNGRSGRPLSNFILVKLGQPTVLIESTEGEEYIAALKTCRNEHNTAPMVDFFFNTVIKRMESGVTLKKEMTKENDFDYSI